MDKPKNKASLVFIRGLRVHALKLKVDYKELNLIYESTELWKLKALCKKFIYLYEQIKDIKEEMPVAHKKNLNDFIL